MSVQAGQTGLHPNHKWLLLAVCLGQVGLIALPFLKTELAPLIVTLVLISVVALLASVTLALLYLCVISAVVPSQFFEDHLLLPLDFKFYEGLFAVVLCTALISWLQETRLAWRQHSRLDRPVLIFLFLVVLSMGLGQYYGQSTSQMLRDARYPLYFTLFFAVTGYFDVRKSGTLLTMLIISSAVVGLEYLAEFLDIVDLSISGSFYRVARMEGLMMPIGVLVIASTLLFDPSLRRRVFGVVMLIPIGLALVLTVGRGMWIALAVGLSFLGLLALRDRQAAARRGRRILILALLPFLVVGMGYLFQQATRAGVGEIAVARLARVMDYEQDHSIVGRLMSYRIALEEIWKRPLLGGGHGATVTYLVTDPLQSFMLTTGDVDNVYLTILLRMGVLGLLAFLWIFLKGLQMAYRTFQRTANPGVRLFCASFFAVYGAMLIYGMADNTMMGNRLIFWHAAFLGILARLERETGNDLPHIRPTKLEGPHGPEA